MTIDFSSIFKSDNEREAVDAAGRGGEGEGDLRALCVCALTAPAVLRQAGKRALY